MIPLFIWILNRFTKNAFDVLAHFVWGKGSAIEEARIVFRMYDQDNNGSLDIDELESALRDLRIDISRKRLQSLIADIDDGDSWIGEQRDECCNDAKLLHASLQFRTLSARCRRLS